MKRLLIVGGIVVVFLAIVGFGVAYALPYAQSALAGHSQTSTSSAAATGTAGANSSSTGNQQGNNARSVEGVITSLNNQTIVLQAGHAKKTVNVTVSDSTKYATLEGQATFSDLKVGQTVQVVGQLDAQNQTVSAVRVILLPPLGKVSTVNGQALTLTTSDGKTVQVNTSSSTIVSVVLEGGSVAVSAKDIKVGELLGYQGTADSSGAVSATKLWLLGLPQLHGTVSAINGNVLTLQGANGSSYTVNLSSDTTYVQFKKSQSTSTASSMQAIKVGSKVGVIADSKAAGASTNALLVVVV